MRDKRISLWLFYPSVSKFPSEVTRGIAQNGLSAPKIRFVTSESKTLNFPFRGSKHPSEQCYSAEFKAREQQSSNVVWLENK